MFIRVAAFYRKWVNPYGAGSTIFDVFLPFDGLTHSFLIEEFSIHQAPTENDFVGVDSA